MARIAGGDLPREKIMMWKEISEETFRLISRDSWRSAATGVSDTEEDCPQEDRIQKQMQGPVRVPKRLSVVKRRAHSSKEVEKHG